MREIRLHIVGNELRSVTTSSTGLGVQPEVSEGRIADALWPEDQPTPTPATHYIVADGTLAAYTDAHRMAKQMRPPYWAEWSNATMSWVDKRTPTDLANIERSKVDREIAAEEKTTLRALRELMLALPAGTFSGPPAATAAARKALRDADDDIVRKRNRRPA
jgi:hypothetical protein